MPTIQPEFPNRDEELVGAARYDEAKQEEPEYLAYCHSIWRTDLARTQFHDDTEQRWIKLKATLEATPVDDDQYLVTLYRLTQFVEAELEVIDPRRRDTYDEFATALIAEEHHLEAVSILIRLGQWYVAVASPTEQTEIPLFHTYLDMSECYLAIGRNDEVVRTTETLLQALPEYVYGHGRSVQSINEVLPILVSATSTAVHAENTDLCDAVYKTLLRVTGFPDLSIQPAREKEWRQQPELLRLDLAWGILATRCALRSERDLEGRALHERLRCAESRVRIFESAPIFVIESIELVSAKGAVSRAACDLAKWYQGTSKYHSAASAIKRVMQFAEVLDLQTAQDAYDLARRLLRNLESEGLFEDLTTLLVKGSIAWPTVPHFAQELILRWIVKEANHMCRMGQAPHSKLAFDEAAKIIERLEREGSEILPDTLCSFLLGRISLEEYKVHQDENAGDTFFAERHSHFENDLNLVLKLCSLADSESFEDEPREHFSVLAHLYLGKFAKGRSELTEASKHADEVSRLLGDDPEKYPERGYVSANEASALYLAAGVKLKALKMSVNAYRAVCKDESASALEQAKVALHLGNTMLLVYQSETNLRAGIEEVRSAVVEQLERFWRIKKDESSEKTRAALGEVRGKLREL